jgi:hypothetical protein
MGRADLKVEVLDAKLCSKCSGVLKDGRSVHLLNCTPAALLEVLTIEMFGQADGCRMCLRLQGCCGQPLVLQQYKPGAGKSEHWLEQTHQMRGLHCCHNTAMRTGRTQQLNAPCWISMHLAVPRMACFGHRLCVQTMPACAEDESFVRQLSDSCTLYAECRNEVNRQEVDKTSMSDVGVTPKVVDTTDQLYDEEYRFYN